jgi:4-hydroxy-2-oxoheptanedioate aldolase
LNSIRETLSEGKTTVGTWCSLASNVGAEFLGSAGYDWVVIDLQHGAATMDALMSLIQAVELGGSPVVVRVPRNDPTYIGRALDLGAIGINIPMISDVDDARQAVASIRHQPRGIKSFGPIRGRRGFTGAFATPDDEICIVMIETAGAFAQASEIAAVDGVDVLFVGPADLAKSQQRELRGGTDDAALGAVAAVVAAAEKHGKVGGTLTSSHEYAAELLRRGVRFLSLGSDIAHVAAGARRDVEQIGEWRAASD